MTKLAEPPPHFDHKEDEARYVLVGKLTVHIGDLVLEAVPGTLVFAPRDIRHCGLEFESVMGHSTDLAAVNNM
jgi:quercetin dioxygenase-like cupin family protein